MERGSVELRRATPEDIPAIHELIQQLAEFEREPDAVDVTLDQRYQDFEEDAFSSFVCTLDGDVVGIALYYFRYSTWKGSFIHLEDLIVRPEHRGNGYGRLLLEAIIFESNKKGCRRVGWEVLDWNTPAVKFYESIGATIEKEWWQCRLYADDISQFDYVYSDTLKALEQ